MDEAEILEAIEKVKAFIPYDDSYNNTGVKRLAKLELALEFSRLKDPNIIILRDEVIIDGKYIATLAGKKWRVRGKRGWYRYAQPVDLLHKIRGSEC